MTAIKPAATSIYTAGYLRLTRDESLATGLSAPSQRKGIHEYAEKAGLNPIKIFEETKAVGGDVPFEKRQAGKLLIAAIRAGEVRAIVTRDIDRLSRDVRLWLDLFELCREHGVTIHTFSGPLQSKSASDRFAIHVRSAAAEFEKNQVGDRVRKAKQEAVAQGRWPGGPPPLGFISQAKRRSDLIAAGIPVDDAEVQASNEYPVKRKLYHDPKEVEVIQVITELALAGLGSRRITGELNKRGYRTRTGAYWSSERLSRTLNNPAICGYLGWDSELEKSGKHTPKQRQKLIKGNHDPIITIEQWKKIQQLRIANTDPHLKAGRFSGTRSYPFAGILRCKCGSPMKGKSYRARLKGARYVCSRALYFGRGTVNGCDSDFNSIPTSCLHETVWEKLRGMLAGPDLIDRVFVATQKIQKEASKQRSHTGELVQTVEKIEAQITLWYRRHDNATNEQEQEAAWRRIVELTGEKKQFEQAKIEQEKLGRNPTRISKEQIAEYLGSMSKLLDNHGGEDAKRMIRSLVDHHGLILQLTGPETLVISLDFKTPGVVTGETVPVKTEAFIPRDKVKVWLRDNEGKHACQICGKPVRILRRHFWLGVPKYHLPCWNSKLGERRSEGEAGLMTGQAVAKLCGVGRTTIGRWIASGRLPAPIRRNGLLLWSLAQVKHLKRR